MQRLVALALVVVACVPASEGGPQDPPPPAPDLFVVTTAEDPPRPTPGQERQRALDQARTRWEASGVIDYEMVYDVQCFCTFQGPWTVRVVAGDVPDRPDGVPGFVPMTVDGVFRAIEADINGARIDVTYDDALGYPVEAYIDPVRYIFDEEVRYRITELNPAD